MKPPKAYATYEDSIEAERLREKKRRHTRQGAFEASMISFEETQENYYPLAAVMGSRAKSDPEFLKTALRRYMKAYQRVRRKLPECLEVFNLILKNGKERQKSIWEMVNKIKKQSGVLKKTHSTKRCGSSTTDDAKQSASSSALKTKMRVKNSM